jgi:hypothetical protein
LAGGSSTELSKNWWIMVQRGEMRARLVVGELSACGSDWWSEHGAAVVVFHAASRRMEAAW